MKRLAPFLIGIAAAVLGGAIGWLIVGRSAQVWSEVGSYTAGPEFAVIILLSVMLGVVGGIL